MFLQNKYLKWYIELTSKKNRCLNGYTEKHHIIPRSLGGGNNVDNIVKLTAREHFVAHLLLTKITTGKNLRSMLYALWNMVNRDNGIRTSSKMYALLRENHSKFLSEELSGKGNPMYGKKHTEEQRKKISEGGKGLKRNIETRKKISDANKGSKNSNFGIPRTPKQKEAQSDFMKAHNPMYNLDVVEKIKQSKKETINCFDTLSKKFVRVKSEIYYANKDRYKNNTSNEAKEFKRSLNNDYLH